MSGEMRSETNLAMSTIIGAIAFLASCFMLAYLAHTGVSRTGLMVPVTIGWITALITIRPLVDQDKHTALNFAFGIMALMVFFIHETYGYTGKVRNFPLIIGYTGVGLCILDVLSLTNTTIGTTIARLFGSHLDKAELGGRRVQREIIAFAAMGGCVLGIWLFGFLVFSPIFVALWMIAGGKKVKNAFYGGIFTVLFIYFLFEAAFKYDLYRGVVFIWLLDL